MFGYTAREFRLGIVTAYVMAMVMHSCAASVADLQFPEEWNHAEEFNLGESATKTADAHTHYMLAIFEEENEGPEKSIASKERVLHHDPGFSSLAIDVAQHHLRHRNFAEALAVLKDTATANPEDPAPLMALASIYLRHLEKPALAEKYALSLRKINPDNPEAIELLCEIFRTGGKSSRIELLLETATKSESTDPAYWIALAEIRLRELSKSRLSLSAKNKKIIVNLAHKAMTLARGDAFILAASGDVFALLGNPQAAIDAYKTALESPSEPDGAREKLANCLLETGDDEAALHLLDQLVKKNPLSLRSYDQLARIHFSRKNFPLAVANMRQAMRLAPVNPARFEELVRAALLAEDSATAIQFSTEGEQRFPYLTGFTVLRAVALSQAGDHHSALAAFERALVKAANTNPELLNSGFYMSYGSAAERAGHYVKAAELLKKSIALDPPGSAEACNYLGYMWADRNENLIEAEALIRRALELDSENSAYRDSLGWALYRQGRYDQALAELLRAATGTEKSDPVILEHVGDAYEKLNRSAEALSFWQKALHLAPENASLAAKIDHLTQPVVCQPESPRSQGIR